MRWLVHGLAALLLMGAGPLWAQPVIHGISTSPHSPIQVAAAVLFNADASVAGGGSLEYRWDFGDGTPRTDWLPVAQVSHSYQGAGVFTVLLQVRHATQGLSSATRVLVVRLAPAAAARHDASILVHPSRREVWSVNPDHGTLSVLGADALLRVAEVPVGTEPVALAVDPAGQVWVALAGEDVLNRVDPLTRLVSATLELGYGARPAALVIGIDGQGYVALAGAGAVLRFDSMGVVAGTRVPLAPQLQALALSADGGSLHVSRLVSAGAQGEIWRIALPDLVVASIGLPLDTTSPDSGTAGRGLPNYVGTLALAEDGRSLWYGAKKDNVLRGMFREGQPLTFETVVRSLLGRIDTTATSEQVSLRMDLDNAARVATLLLPPGSSHLFATQDSNNRVLVLDPWNRRELARITTGLAPRGLAYDAQTRRLFVRNELSRTVGVYAVGAMLDDGQTPPALLAQIAATLSEPLSPQVLLGKQVFHNAEDTRMSQDGYSACAVCHLDGRGDGRVWDFTQLGEGLRNTTSLRGAAGLGRGLVHWSGNFDEIQDFEVPIRNLFGGSGFMSNADYFAQGRNHPLGPPKAGFSEELDALAAYVATLDVDDRSPWRQSDGALTSDGQLGRQLFAQLNCQRCHAGPAFTDSAAGFRHDVGTLSAASGQRLGEALVALDTPSLRGLSGSAPYLHDGSAATLEEVLVARNPAGRHGEAAALAAGQREQLISFLLQIDASEPGLALPAALALQSPPAAAQYRLQQTVPLSIQTNLPQITRVDYHFNGVVLASAQAPPWNAHWVVAVELQGAVDVHAHVFHDQGRFNTLSAPVRIEVLGDVLLADGFE